MMLLPRGNEFDLLGEMFKDSFFTERENKIMKTDIRETEKQYLIDIDLPGYSKDDIKIEVNEGYLIVQAEINSSKEEKENDTFVRRERYRGNCSRSFYIGKNIEEEEIKAAFKNGILSLEVPKKDAEKEIPQKKYIQITD